MSSETARDQSRLGTIDTIAAIASTQKLDQDDKNKNWKSSETWEERETQHSGLSAAPVNPHRTRSLPKLLFTIFRKSPMMCPRFPGHRSIRAFWNLGDHPPG